MKKETKKRLVASICFLAAFVVWTLAVCFVDIRAIGPEGSTVGFGAINGFVHGFTGVNMALYTVTDWLGLVPFAFVAGFGILGLVQWIKRKHIKNVDFSLLVLGGFYIVVMAVFAFFEVVVINYRPVLIEGNLEASYPSSTTMLVLCVMPTTVIELRQRIKGKILRSLVVGLILAFAVFMVVARLASGVHWLSDIAGGVLLSAGLVSAYGFVCRLGEDKLAAN